MSSGKIIYSFTDENPDLQKQMGGCMNGIFHLFDRHYFLSGRRTPRKTLPPGQSGNNDTNGILQKAKDRNQKKAASNEKQRTSTESSRTSFSSSSCSSTFSSLDCNKISQLEQPFSIAQPQIIAPETPSKALPITTQSLDLRDVVKDSINREPRGLLITTTKKEVTSHPLKHIDSPRPMLLTKTVKPRVSNINDSSQNLAKRRDWNPCETKDRRILATRDSPRFSYDGRESKEKSSIKLKEVPRLSLDSKTTSTRRASFDSKSNSLIQNQIENTNSRTFKPHEEMGCFIRPSSVVAKLMGLEPLPSSIITEEGKMGQGKPVQEQNIEPLSRSSSNSREINQNNISGSPRNRQQGVISSSLRNVDSFTSPSISSRILVESAPWKHSDANRGSHKPTLKYLELPIKAPNSYPSVYGEIEKRLAELEFRKSGMDLRALKQLLEAMQKTRETQETNQYQASGQRSKLAIQRSRTRPSVSSTVKQSSPGSPILIMKPAAFVRKSKDPSSTVIPIEILSGLHKLRTGELKDKDRNSNRYPCSTDNTFSPRIRAPQVSKLPQQTSVESPSSSGRSSEALSPRLQRKQPRPITPPSDSSKPRRQSSGYLLESNSPVRKMRPRALDLQHDDQTREINNNIRCSSIGHSKEIISNFYQQGGQKHKNQVARLSEDGSAAELGTATPEQPSPVSVLDAMFYKDDLPSPVKKISLNFEDEGTSNSYELDWPAKEQHHISDSVGSNLSFDTNHTNLMNTEQVVKKLTQLNSPTAENSITPLPENGDHKYIYEILLASGILSREFGTCLMTIQVYPTDYFLNPELFLVLEQTNTKQLSTHEKIHRKLTFDTVNEILLAKLVSTCSTEPRFSQRKAVKRIPTGQQLLKEVCSEIHQHHLQANNSDISLEDDSDIFRSILSEDLRQQSSSWTDFDGDVSGLVLDIERLIFKDLVTEVVDGEAKSILARIGGHCRKLFH